MSETMIAVLDATPPPPSPATAAMRESYGHVDGPQIEHTSSRNKHRHAMSCATDRAPSSHEKQRSKHDGTSTEDLGRTSALAILEPGEIVYLSQITTQGDECRGAKGVRGSNPDEGRAAAQVMNDGRKGGRDGLRESD
jgi:hypothetical protein